MSLVYPLTGLSRVDVSGIPINTIDAAQNASDIDGLQSLTSSHATRLSDAESATGALDTRVGTNESDILAKQPLLTGAATSVASSDLAPSKAVVSSASGKLTVSETSSASLDFIAGLGSSLVTQLAAKEPTVSLATNRAVVSDGAGALAASAVTAIELALLAGVTSQVQTQLNAKQATLTGAATTVAGADLAVSRALVSSATGKVEASAATAVEVGHL